MHATENNHLLIITKVNYLACRWTDRKSILMFLYDVSNHIVAETIKIECQIIYDIYKINEVKQFRILKSIIKTHSKAVISHMKISVPSKPKTMSRKVRPVLNVFNKNNENEP